MLRQSPLQTPLWTVTACCLFTAGHSPFPQARAFSWLGWGGGWDGVGFPGCPGEVGVIFLQLNLESRLGFLVVPWDKMKALSHWGFCIWKPRMEQGRISSGFKRAGGICSHNWNTRIRTDPSSPRIHPFLSQWPQLSMTFPQAEAAGWYPTYPALLPSCFTRGQTLTCCIAQCDPVTHLKASILVTDQLAIVLPFPLET